MAIQKPIKASGTKEEAGSEKRCGVAETAGPTFRLPSRAVILDEGRKTGSSKHPNNLDVHEAGEQQGIPYIAMESVEGEPLEKAIQAEELPPMVECLRIVEELCSALAYAHQTGVIHRDVRPANIFVQPDGRVKLVDFGIVRLGERKSKNLSLSRDEHVIEELAYMAPERLQNKPLDARSDIFAVGVVLYQLVSGQLPFSGNEAVMMQRILNESHAPLSTLRKDCPPGLDAIVDRTLAKLPEDRYATADELAADLATIIADIRHKGAPQLSPEAKRLTEAQELYTQGKGDRPEQMVYSEAHGQPRTNWRDTEDQEQAEIIHRAEEVLGDRSDAMRWLGTPVRALNYATPVSLLHDPKGREDVLAVLGRLEHGVL
jgi:serine/threonine-protein kinase